MGVEEWTGILAAHLERLEATLPSGNIPTDVAVAIQQTRGVGEMEEGGGRAVVHHGGAEGSWTVVFQPHGDLKPSCLHRTVSVLPVKSLEEALGRLEEWKDYLQSVGVAGVGGETPEILERLARMGVSRITTLDGLPWPPPWWHHDGSGPLRDMVRWADLEMDGWMG